MMRRDACIYCSCRTVVIVHFNECTYTERVQTGFGDLIAANQINKKAAMRAILKSEAESEELLKAD